MSISKLHPLPFAIPSGGWNGAFVSLENETGAMFESIADKIQKSPDLLQIPINNIARWLAKGHPNATRLNAWKSKIESAMHSPSALAELIWLLRDTSPEAMKWKGCSPFAGVLSAAELDALR